MQSKHKDYSLIQLVVFLFFNSEYSVFIDNEFVNNNA